MEYEVENPNSGNNSQNEKLVSSVNTMKRKLQNID